MINLPELVQPVNEQFAARDPELVLWPDPHSGRQPADEEYSRATNPLRWRILGARVDAWVAALLDAGLASVQQVALKDIRWAGEPRSSMSSAVRVVPSAAGARPLLVARSQVGDVPETGITLGWGDPAVLVGLFPDCGCDACDDGAQLDLDRLDEHLASIMIGGHRRLSRGDRQIIAHGDREWSATGEWEFTGGEAVQVDPTGRQRLSGASWLG